MSTQRSRIDRHQVQTIDSLRVQFDRFGARVCPGSTRMYEILSAHVSASDRLLGLSRGVLSGQPAPNVFYAAVQYTLHQQPGHALARYYPMISGGDFQHDSGFVPAFDEFCIEFADEISQLVASRRVQSSEPRRCGLIVPALLGVAPAVHLIDVGASAGFNMFWDRWSYSYAGVGKITGDRPVGLMKIEAAGEMRPPTVGRLPRVLSRVGVDVAPIRSTDEDAMLWLKCLIFADHTDRFPMFDRAVAIVRAAEPELVRGDARVVIPDLIKRIPDDRDVCLLFSFVINQAYAGGRDEAKVQLAALSGDRPIHEITLADLGGETTELVRATYRRGELVDESRLAYVDPHGRWIRWLHPDVARASV